METEAPCLTTAFSRCTLNEHDLQESLTSFAKGRNIGQIDPVQFAWLGQVLTSVYSRSDRHLNWPPDRPCKSHKPINLHFRLARKDFPLWLQTVTLQNRSTACIRSDRVGFGFRRFTPEMEVIEKPSCENQVPIHFSIPILLKWCISSAEMRISGERWARPILRAASRRLKALLRVKFV